jgi:hypothetical protein
MAKSTVIKKPNPSASANKSQKPIVYSPIDSLKKYEDSAIYFTDEDTIHLFYSQADLYIGEANGVEFGVSQISDSTFAFYQKTGTSWIREAILPVDFCPGNFKLLDLNGDRTEDLIINSYNGYGMPGNIMSQFFFFNKQVEKFQYCQCSAIFNTYIDTINHLIGCEWYRTNGTEGSKELYKVEHFSMIFLKGVALGGNLFRADHKSHLRYYTIKGNKEVTFGRWGKGGFGEKEVDIKTDLYKDESYAQKIYDKTFWNSE